MTLTPEQKEHAIHLIEIGEKLEAVRYLQNLLSLTAEQALALTEKLEAEVEDGPDLKQEFLKKSKEMQRSGIKLSRIVGGIFMSIGIIMVVVSIYLIYSHQQFEKKAIVVTGKVVDFETYISTDDNSSTTMYRPVFEYAYKGKTYTYPSTGSSSSKGFEIGEPVEIYINPDQPEDVLVNSFMEKWFLPMLLAIMGTAFAGMGYLAVRLLGRS